MSLVEYCPSAITGGGIADLATRVQKLVMARAEARVKTLMVGHIAEAMGDGSTTSAGSFAGEAGVAAAVSAP